MPGITVHVSGLCRFFEARMQKAKKQQTVAARAQLEQEIHLVRAPGALEAEKLKAEKLKVAVEEPAQAEDMQE